MITEATTTLAKTELFVNEIMFYGKDDISLLGFLHDGGQFIETEYVISRNHLKMLLSTNKRSGVEILWRMEQLFIYPHDMPATINLVDIFGTTQVFDAHEIVLEIPASQDDLGNIIPTQSRELLFVNTILPLTATRKNYF